MSQRRGPVLPDLDVLQGIFSRQAIVPGLVARFADLVAERRLFLLGWLRQNLLARVIDERQGSRLERLLAPFPDLPVLPSDHIVAAHRAHRMRREGAPATPLPLLQWTIAERIAGVIWSHDRQWLRLARHGCPVVTDP